MSFTIFSDWGRVTLISAFAVYLEGGPRMKKSLEATGKLLEPIELDDVELAAVAGGFFDFNNSSNSGNVSNSFNNAFNNSRND